MQIDLSNLPIDVGQVRGDPPARRVDHAVGDVAVQNVDIATVALLSRRGLDTNELGARREMPVVGERDRVASSITMRGGSGPPPHPALIVGPMIGL